MRNVMLVVCAMVLAAAALTTCILIETGCEGKSDVCIQPDPNEPGVYRIWKCE